MVRDDFKKIMLVSCKECVSVGQEVIGKHKLGYCVAMQTWPTDYVAVLGNGAETGNIWKEAEDLGPDSSWGPREEEVSK